MRAGLAMALGASVAILPACRLEETIVAPDPQLDRMVDQPKRLPYQEDPSLPHGMAMQSPPEGTLAVDALVGDALLTDGAAKGHWAEHIPLGVDRPLVERGRNRFDVFCAPCHGVLGDGASIVAEKMALRPPSLHDARIAAYPVGRVFQTIRRGYGLMPSYAVQLSISDAWAVVAYVGALRLARRADIVKLAPDVRAQLASEAP